MISFKHLKSISFAALVAFPVVADELDGVNWQDAVAELAAEKTRAEACVSLAKQVFDDPGAKLASVQLDYSSAKAEMDAIIGGLVVVLAVEDEPEDFSTFETRLTEAVSLREKFCKTVVANLPEDVDQNTKGVVSDILGKGVAALISAAKDIYIFHQEEDDLERKTIQTQIEATKWKDFAEVPG